MSNAIRERNDAQPRPLDDHELDIVQGGLTALTRAAFVSIPQEPFRVFIPQEPFRTLFW